MQTPSDVARSPVWRARWVIAAAAMVGMLVTARLGLWQLDRAHQKESLQAMIDSRSALAPVPAGMLATTLTAASEQHYRLIRLQGRWKNEATVFLDNRQMNGKPGFFVVTPLLLDDGSAVLVQRGWGPRNGLDRSAVPAVVALTERVDVTGRIAPPPGRLFEFESAASGPIRQNIDLARFAQEWRLMLHPLSIQQSTSTIEPNTGDPGVAQDTLLRDWPKPAVDVDKHYGYAFQWFALALMIATLYVWFQLIRPRRLAG